ncbi:MAG: hypothetical protein AAGC85_14030 [Bacteroidota bacterium]
MKTGNLLAELFLIGTGTAIVVFLALFVVFGANMELVSEPERYLYFANEGIALTILIGPGIFCLLGVVIDSLSHTIFLPWELSLKKGFQPKGQVASKRRKKTLDFYNQVMNYILAGEKADSLAMKLAENQSKIKLSRSWAVNLLLLEFMLIWYDSASNVFDPFLFPAIFMVALLLVGCLVSWYLSVSQELKWLDTYQENLL